MSNFYTFLICATLESVESLTADSRRNIPFVSSSWNKLFKNFETPECIPVIYVFICECSNIPTNSISVFCCFYILNLTNKTFKYITMLFFLIRCNENCCKINNVISVCIRVYKQGKINLKNMDLRYIWP